MVGRARRLCKNSLNLQLFVDILGMFRLALAGARASLNMTDVKRRHETQAAAEQIPRAGTALGMAGRDGGRQWYRPRKAHWKICYVASAFARSLNGCRDDECEFG
jgi:hypothetical protein